jgi:hypothetical protein
MTNIPALFEIRMGIEATDAWGTAVAQTVKLMDVEDFNLTPMMESVQIKDRRGTLAPGYSSLLNKLHGSATLSGFLNLEQSPYWFNSLLQDVTPTTDAAGNTWNWVAPGSDGAPPVNSFTIAFGVPADINSVKSLRGATVRDIQISGAVNDQLKLTANFIGAAVDTDTFDSDAEADVTTQILKGCDVSLWIDPDSDAVGTTAIASTGFDFDLNINTNRETFTYLGSAAAGNYREARYEGSLRLGLELNTTSAAYIDSILSTSSDALTKKVVRILAQVDTDNYLQFDFNGVALEAPQLFSDRDGISTIDLMLVGQYGATLGNWLKVEARNSADAF